MNFKWAVMATRRGVRALDNRGRGFHLVDIAARIDGGDKKLTVEEWKCGDVVKLVERVELAALSNLQSGKPVA